MKGKARQAVCALLAATAISAAIPTISAEQITNAAAEIDESYSFIFGGEKDGSISVYADTAYGEQDNGMTYGFIGIEGSQTCGTNGMWDGYGFDTDTPVTHLKNGAYTDGTYVETDYDAYDDEFTENLAGGLLPLRFSAELEEHRYYNVTAVIVNTSDTESAKATLTSEKRHIILFEEELEPGETITKTFNVNLESVYANGKVNSDSIINVCVSGRNVGLASVRIDKMSEFGQTLWVLGDSTVCDQWAVLPYYPLNTYSGIGQFLPMYINPDIAVSNQAEGGLKAWDENHYNNAVEHMNAGDYLWVQYGINDKAYYNDTDKFKRQIEKYYTSSHEKGIKLIIASTIDHHNTISGRKNIPVNWNEDARQWESTMSEYCAAAKEFVEDKIACGADDIAFIDINTPYVEWMNEATGEVYEQRARLGYSDEGLSKLAINYYFYSDWSKGIDMTHTNDLGADNAAAIAVQNAKDTIEAAGADKTIVRIEAEYNKDGSLKEIMSIDEISVSEYAEPQNTALSKTFYWENIDGMKPYVPSEDDTDENTLIQAELLAGLIYGAAERNAAKVSDKIVAEGWVPNSTFPIRSGAGNFEYPLDIESVEIADGNIVSVQVQVQGSMGYYAQGTAEIYDADGERTAVLYTTDHIDNTAATYGNEYTLYFDTSDTENFLAEGYAYKVYMQSKGSEEPIIYSEEYTDSYMRTVTLSYAAGSEGKGTVIGGGSYPVNSEVTISAETTVEGYIFAGWYNDDGMLYSTEQKVKISKLTDNLSLTAKFTYPAAVIAKADFEDSDETITAEIGSISGDAENDSEHGGDEFGNMAKLYDGSYLEISPDETADGEITVEFDAYYLSNENGKYSIIQLNDANGNALADVKFSRYGSSGCHIKIGGETIYSGNDAWNFIRDGKAGGSTVGNCTGVNVDYAGSKETPKIPLETTTHITISVDTDEGTAYIEFRSNTSTDRYSIVSGNVGSGTEVQSLYLYANFSEEKAMWVDNIIISKTPGEKFSDDTATPTAI